MSSIVLALPDRLPTIHATLVKIFFDYSPAQFSMHTRAHAFAIAPPPNQPSNQMLSYVHVGFGLFDREGCSALWCLGAKGYSGAYIGNVGDLRFGP